MNSPLVKPWTEDEIETLKRMWPFKSAAIIATELGRPRSGVIGKAHRLKLMKKDQREITSLRHPRTPRPEPVPKPAKVPRQKKVKKEKTGLIDPVIPAPTGATVTYGEIVISQQCVFIFGDDYLAAIRRDEALFCGSNRARFRTDDGEIHKSPFCAEHHRLCYTPIDTRRREPGSKHWKTKR